MLSPYGSEFAMEIIGVVASLVAAIFGVLSWRRSCFNERPQISSMQIVCEGDWVFFRIHVQPGSVFEQILNLKVPGYDLALTGPQFDGACAEQVIQRSPLLKEISVCYELEPGLGHRAVYFALKEVPRSPFHVELKTKSHGVIVFDVGENGVSDLVKQYESRRLNGSSRNQLNL